MEENQTQTIKSKPPKSYLLYFLSVYLVAELILIGVDLYYVYARGDTAKDFLFDFLVVTAIITVLVLMTYFAVKRILVRYMESEQRFRELAGLLPVAVYETDREGCIHYANELAIQWFGYSAADVEAGDLNAKNMVAEVDWERGKADFFKALAGAPPTPQTYNVVRKDGSTFPVVISYSRVVSHGRIVGLRGVMTDVSAQVKIEQEVRRSGEKYRSLFESSIDGIEVVDFKSGKIVEANQAMLDMIGYTRAQLARKEYWELTPGTWFLQEGRIFRDQVLERGYSDEYEKEIVASDGTVIPVSVRRWLIRDDDGTPTGMWSTIRDITEKKAREREIEKVNSELKLYAHAVSHDLKSPIHGVTLASYTVEKLLKMPRTPENEQFMADALQSMKNGLEKANNLIDDMLALAESGQVPADVFPVDISEKVEEVLAERASDIEIRGTKVVLDDDLGVVIASPTHVYQIFSNLVKNAVRYCDSPAPVLEIRSLEADEPETHRFLVRDNGTGIPEDVLSEVFMPFTRGDTGDSGIGLSIVERIVSVYGGRILAYNDSGACFEFTLRDFPVE